MKRIFLRFFAFVMVSVSVASLLIYALVTWFFGDPLEQSAARQAAPQIFLLEQYVDKASTDDWLNRLNKVREVSDVKFEIIPLQQALPIVPATRRADLQRGAIVIDAKGKSFFRRVDVQGQRYAGSEDDVLQVQGLPIDTLLTLKLELTRFVVIALALLVPIVFWSRSHWLDLQKLANMANAVGSGDLSARVALKESANLFPLSLQLNQMADRIRTLLGAQQHLMHSVSHELRTPIARLEFGMELLHKQAKDLAMETRIEKMRDDLGELDCLVSELLQMAKTNQTHTLQSAPFDVVMTLKTCVESLQHELSAHQIRFEFVEEIWTINADQALLARAMNNLLKNAAKYASTCVTISLKKTADQGIQIAISDDGPGIPETERERIFEPFYRLDRSRDRATGGFGFGLAIALQAVKQHGGKITVHASNLGGAQFVVHLPAALLPN